MEEHIFQPAPTCSLPKRPSLPVNDTVTLPFLIPLEDAPGALPLCWALGYNTVVFSFSHLLHSKPSREVVSAGFITEKREAGEARALGGIAGSQCKLGPV